MLLLLCSNNFLKLSSIHIYYFIKAESKGATTFVLKV
uniref:Uncharacterized protein n=1 Tax=Arundo donax TaxID=35708 RepID=A0A0A9F1T0_ARUDO